MLFPLFLAGHLIGDWIVQTDRQARLKVWPWTGPAAPWTYQVSRTPKRAWWTSAGANQGHMLTYHLAMAAFVLPAWHTRATLAAFAVSWVTHSFIDRRWPVRALLRATGSGEFAEGWGVMAADQALHLSILAVIAYLAGS